MNKLILIGMCILMMIPVVTATENMSSLNYLTQPELVSGANIQSGNYKMSVAIINAENMSSSNYLMAVGLFFQREVVSPPPDGGPGGGTGGGGILDCPIGYYYDEETNRCQSIIPPEVIKEVSDIGKAMIVQPTYALLGMMFMIMSYFGVNEKSWKERKYKIKYLSILGGVFFATFAIFKVTNIAQKLVINPTLLFVGLFFIISTYFIINDALIKERKIRIQYIAITAAVLLGIVAVFKIPNIQENVVINPTLLFLGIPIALIVYLSLSKQSLNKNKNKMYKIKEKVNGVIR